LGGNPPNHLGDFQKGIMIKALFFGGQCGPCVDLWRKIGGSVGGTSMAIETCGNWGKEMENSWKSVWGMYVFVCVRNGKMVERLDVFVVFLCY
jgi:hypothetical protein